mmetsp:Transcript_14296/g.35886  ORF Transcript_14296/g.35886 Transcript_14296/m.35886 type:complete len:163 (+) Transcript_14296:1278-1766(+)
MTIASETSEVIARALLSEAEVPRKVAPLQTRRGSSPSKASTQASSPEDTKKESVPGLVMTDTTPSAVEAPEEAIWLRRRPPDASINVYCGEEIAFTEEIIRNAANASIILRDGMLCTGMVIFVSISYSRPLFSSCYVESTRRIYERFPCQDMRFLAVVTTLS